MTKVGLPEVPDVVLKKPAPELVNVNETPLVCTELPYWSCNCTVTVVFVEPLGGGLVELNVICAWVAAPRLNRQSSVSEQPVINRATTVSLRSLATRQDT